MFPALTELNLCDDEMTYLPPDLSRLKHLANLNLNGNNFQDVFLLFNCLVLTYSISIKNFTCTQELIYKSPLRRASRFYNENS